MRIIFQPIEEDTRHDLSTARTPVGGGRFPRQASCQDSLLGPSAARLAFGRPSGSRRTRDTPDPGLDLSRQTRYVYLGFQ